MKTKDKEVVKRRTADQGKPRSRLTRALKDSATEPLPPVTGPTPLPRFARTPGMCWLVCVDSLFMLCAHTYMLYCVIDQAPKLDGSRDRQGRSRLHRSQLPSRSEPPRKRAKPKIKRRRKQQHKALGGQNGHASLIVCCWARTTCPRRMRRARAMKSRSWTCRASFLTVRTVELVPARTPVQTVTLAAAIHHCWSWYGC